MVAMKLLKSQHNRFPNLYKEVEIKSLENRYPLKPGSDNLELFEDLSSTGLIHPIILSYVGSRICTGHRRVHWAESRGYTHISAIFITEGNSANGTKGMITTLLDILDLT